MPSDTPTEPSPTDRRTFLCSVACASAAAMGLAMIAAPVTVTLTPLLEPAASADTWIRLGPATRFPTGAPPTRVVLQRDERDAWLSRSRTLGVVYIQRPADDTWLVHSGLCPHLGCGVEFQSDRFTCPCHGATFDRSGALGPSTEGGPNPAKRPLDTLETRLVEGSLEVKWQRFRPDTADKQAVG